MIIQLLSQVGDGEFELVLLIKETRQCHWWMNEISIEILRIEFICRFWYGFEILLLMEVFVLNWLMISQKGLFEVGF